MPSILFSADLSDALFELLRKNEITIDAVEVGPWFTIDQVSTYRSILPGVPFHFHAADMIENVGTTSNGTNRIIDYLSCTESPWVSVHISVWKPGDLRKINNGQLLPLPNLQTGELRFIQKVRWLAHSISVPVLIENVEPLPLERYDYWSRPDFINRILERTGCGFLLDTGHARISAEALGMKPRAYLQELDLQRVFQVHVSGPRRVDGRLLDVHQSLLTDDYDLFEFVLSQTHPKVVTLEYLQEAN
jgi:uncharacterized protein (UPF0276 family)